MKKLFVGAAFALSALVATSAHAQTTTPDPAVATPQSTQDTYNQQRDQRKAADQTVSDNRRQLKQEQSQTRELKSQMKQQREQAKQQNEQLKMARQQSKVAKQQEKAAKSQMRAEKAAAKAARKAQ
jgi:TolA-binding protein